jgi:regulator of cell morphogenesis and NO signaling
MEFEHEQAKMNLKRFLEKTAKLLSDLSKKEAENIADYVTQAYLTLNEHFIKEENVLFPMAERMFSASEKEELEQKITAV